MFDNPEDYNTAKDYVNDPNIEVAWAIKAHENARMHLNILSAVNPRNLKLSPSDDKIYETFREMFPNMRVDYVEEDEMKSPSAKEKWRQFAEKFNAEVDDYNFGTLLRIDCKEPYDSSNTFLVPRINFLAVEIARNREGYNDVVRDKFKADFYCIPDDEM